MELGSQCIIAINAEMSAGSVALLFKASSSIPRTIRNSIRVLTETNTRVKAVVLGLSDTKKLFAVTYGGIFKSTDSGSNWSACANTNLNNLNVVSLTINVTGKLYAGTEAGIFASSDGCATWTAMNNGMPN